MAKYFFEYTYIDPYSELKENDVAIIEAKNMKEAESLLRLQVVEEIGETEVSITDKYRTSDDARI